MNYTTCQLWKITLKSPLEEHPEPLIYWGYNISEKAATQASIRWADEEVPTGDYRVDTVDLLK